MTKEKRKKIKPSSFLTWASRIQWIYRGSDTPAETGISMACTNNCIIHKSITPAQWQ